MHYIKLHCNIKVKWTGASMPQHIFLVNWDLLGSTLLHYLVHPLYKICAASKLGQDRVSLKANGSPAGRLLASINNSLIDLMVMMIMRATIIKTMIMFNGFSLNCVTQAGRRSLQPNPVSQPKFQWIPASQCTMCSLDTGSNKQQIVQCKISQCIGW